MKNFINVEIKARCFYPEKVEAFLLSAKARFVGTDHQIDTYFNCPNGRLKLRRGNIENNLIYYSRPNNAGPKQSNFQLAPVTDGDGMQTLLANALGIKITVDKKRRIYFIDNIKIHLDEVVGLGSFVEIEASNLNHPHKTIDELHAQCNWLLQQLGIEEEHLIDKSYSDMVSEV